MMGTKNEERAGFEEWLGIKPFNAAHDLAWEAFKAGAAWQRAQWAVPDGLVIAPQEIHLSASDIELINGMCGDGNEESGYGPYQDGTLYIGYALQDDGSKVYGLHISCDECPEEGVATLAEFSAAPAHPAERQEQGEVHSAAARDVLAERKRQITAEDFDASHDDMATRGQIAMAAGLYAIDAANLAAGRISLSHPSSLWPWPEEWWKPAGSRRNLVKAGALILAEIERLDRAALAARTGQEVEK